MGPLVARLAFGLIAVAVICLIFVLRVDDRPKMRTGCTIATVVFAICVVLVAASLRN
jgi:hypothetical protein